MKTRPFALSTSLVCGVLLCSGMAQGQSLVINSVSGTSFCFGDSITVAFTATGAWQHKNAFTLQLSDTAGSFGNGVFTKIAALEDTLDGTFTISAPMPAIANYSPHYRLRVIGANPYTPSADNGSNISYGTANHHQFEQFTAGTINTPMEFSIFPTAARSTRQIDTVYWDFGAGADPAGVIDVGRSTDSYFNQTTTYSTAGLKTVVARSVSPGGCIASDTLLTYIFDCSHRVIPHNAFVIDKDSNIDITTPGMRNPLHTGANIWVNPGVTLTGGELDTIFAEAGSTIVEGSANIVFLKPGAGYSGRDAYAVVYADGASVDPKFAGPGLKCSSDYDFDYTNAPPNVAHPLSVAKNALNLTSITLSPNPTSGIVAIQGLLSENVTVSVCNLLGETVMMQSNMRSPNTSLDLSTLASGAYYIRVSTPTSVVTNKIIRE